MADNKRVQEQLKEITERLEHGIYEVFESDRYQEYLGVMSRFHKYSFNNTMLIAMQKPDATLVAGYDAWKQKFGRYVNKGERGISIIAPNPIKLREEMEKIDPVTGEPILDERGQPVLEEVETTKMAFKVATVFDISQTDGKELPGLVADDLTGTVQNYALFMKTFESVSPVSIGFEEISGDAHGYYHLEDKRIAIQSGMSELQTMKTAIHEMAHAVLHDMDLSKEADNPFEQRKNSSVREVEAESVAYTICTHYGLDTSDYSFSYIAAWSTDKELPELRRSLETIRSTSAALITAIDDNMQALLREESLKRKPILDSDVVIKFSGSMGSEVGYEKIVNMDKKQVRQLFDEIIQRIDNGWEGELHDYLEERGVQFDAISEVEESNAEFYDFEYDYDLNELTDMERLALAKQAELRINRTLYATVSDTVEIRRVNEEKREDIQLSSEEAALLYGYDDYFGIYQLKEGEALLDYRFERMEHLQKRGLEIEKGNYNLVYQGALEKSQTLDDIFEQFNLNHPEDFKGHSLSVSDIVVFRRDGETKAHYVDSFGFAEIPQFIRQTEIEPEKMMEVVNENADFEVDIEQSDTAEPEARKALEGPEIPVYKYSGTYAGEHMEAHWYRMSMRANVACKNTIEMAIAENFDGMHLKHDVVNSVLKTFGEERMVYVLANTIQRKEWDGRFSRDNKEWAQNIPVVEDKDGFGGDRRNDFVVDSHPAVLDGFIDLARKEIQELTAQKEADRISEEENLFIAGYYVVENLQKDGALDIHRYEDMDEAIQAYFALPNDKTKALGIENSKPMKGSLDFIQCKNGIDSVIEDFRKVEGWENPEIMEAVKVVGLALKNHDTEIAYQVAEKYFTIQTVSDGYDYTFYDRNYRELDGGVYDNTDISIQRAMEEILSGEGVPMSDCKVISYEKLQEQVEEVQQQTMEAMPLISDKNELASEVPEAKISFYVAECSEFHDLGEFHENLTLKEAIVCYHAIPADRMNGVKAIGFELQTGQEGIFSDALLDVFYGNQIDVDIVDHVAYIRESTLLWDAMMQLAEAFPEAELLNREAMERLAEDIDAFTQGHDLYEYRDVVEDSEAHIEEIKAMLVRQDTEPLRKWLQEVIDEDFLPEEVQEAEKLLGRLDDIYLRRERNPLTKVEELEESNYNQIDGMLGNLDGENKTSKGSIHERLERAKLSLEHRHTEPLPKGNSKSKEESIN